jgi:hypothetical protein
VLHLSQEVPLLVEYGLGSGHLRFYLAPKVSYCALSSNVDFRTCVNVGFQHSSATTSKRNIQNFEMAWAMLKMKLYDNGENLTEEMFFHCIPIRIGDYKMFTIIYTFSGRVFDIANFSSHIQKLGLVFYVAYIATSTYYLSRCCTSHSGRDVFHKISSTKFFHDHQIQRQLQRPGLHLPAGTKTLTTTETVHNPTN